MPKGSPEQKAARRDEIMSACLSLYQTKSFRDISMGDIADYTSFSRPSIYNYFETKEEIFLALFQREYECWTADLEDMIAANERMDASAFADAVARTVEKRTLLLKLLSMNMYDMEEHSRLERLIEFKAAYGASMDTLEKGLEKFFPASTIEKRKDFIWHFFPFMFGIYPYTFATDKQKAAMEQAGTRVLHRSVYELTCGMIAELLKSI